MPTSSEHQSPNESLLPTCTAFEGTRRIASGTLPVVALKVKQSLDRGQHAPLLIFEDETGKLIEVDFRGSPEDVAQRVTAAQPAVIPPGAPAAGAVEVPRKPGRPRLGVVAREVTLLPRHWEWLNRQPGGASVAMRKLVEEARRVNALKDRVRSAQEVAYRFMSAMAGNEPGFEEALRSLFAGDQARFDSHVEGWPIDVRDHARKLSAGAFPPGS